MRIALERKGFRINDTFVIIVVYLYYMLQSDGGNTFDNQTKVAESLLQIKSYDKIAQNKIKHDLIMRCITRLKEEGIEARNKQASLKKMLMTISAYSHQEHYDFLVNYANIRMTNNVITPKIVSDLAIELLELSSDDTLLDVGSGFGNFLLYTSLQYPNIKLQGIELSEDNALISAIRLSLVTTNYTIDNQDFLDGQSLHSEKFAKIFSHPPFMVRYPQSLYDMINIFKNKIDVNYTSRISSEFIFLNKILSLLDDNGRAVIVVNPSSLSRSSEEKFRKLLVESGLLEGVIDLTQMSTFLRQPPLAMLVLSQNNKFIKMVDIRYHYDFSSMTRTDLAQIDFSSVYAEYNSNDVYKCSFEKLAANFYTLLPMRYLHVKNLEIPYVKRLIDVVESIRQGNQRTLMHFKQYISNENTNIKLLTSSDIDDYGFDVTQLQNLSPESSDEFRRFILKDGDLVITAKSSRIKTAVYEQVGNEKVIVSGGMIIITPNSDKLNPYFLKIFLDSPIGTKLLESIQTGSGIVVININNLERINISCPSMSIQENVVSKYRKLVHNINIYQQKIISLSNEIESLFDENVI